MQRSRISSKILSNRMQYTRTKPRRSSETSTKKRLDTMWGKMILKREMTNEEILKEIEHEMGQKEIQITNKNKTTTMTIAKQILENMDKNTEIEFILQKGLQNDILG